MEDQRRNKHGHPFSLAIVAGFFLCLGVAFSPAHAHAALYGDGPYGGGDYNVGQATTSSVLVSSLNPSTFGASVNVKASVTPSSATGTITFKDGGTIIGTASVSHGSGTLAISSLAVRSHSLTAVYGGSTNYLTSTSSILTQIVNQATSVTILASSANPSTLGNSITLTATVTPSTATGTLTFKDGVTTLHTAILGHGSGFYATSLLAAGSHSLTVNYVGNVTFSGSTSNTLNQTVNAPSSSSAPTDNGGPITVGGGGGGGGGGSRRIVAVSVSSSPSTVSRQSTSSSTTSRKAFSFSSSYPTPSPSSTPLFSLRATSNLRSKPTASSTLIATLLPNWQVTILSSDGQWSKVRTTGGKEGYVLTTNVHMVPTSPSPIPPSSSSSAMSGDTRIVGTSLRLHVSPSLSSSKVTTLSLNAVVQLLSVNGDWAQVQIRTKKGWVVRKYLRR